VSESRNKTEFKTNVSAWSVNRHFSQPVIKIGSHIPIEDNTLKLMNIYTTLKRSQTLTPGKRLALVQIRREKKS